MAAKKDYSYRMIPCEGCGVMRHPTRNPSSDGRQLCRACRSSVGYAKGPRVMVRCEWCGVEREWPPSGADRKFCSRDCMNKMRRARWGDNAKHRRAERERAAIGLGKSAQRRLLAKWTHRAAPCYYGCGRPGDTVDHLIPLVRGGTNHEGNLVPCCRQCNSSKQDKMPIEFRLNRPASSGYMPFRYRVVEARKSARAKDLRQCIVCGYEFQTSGPKRKTCGDPVCSREWTNRTTRDSYRRRVGIPVDVTEPTKYWIRFAS